MYVCVCVCVCAYWLHYVRFSLPPSSHTASTPIAVQKSNVFEYSPPPPRTDKTLQHRNSSASDVGDEEEEVVGEEPGAWREAESDKFVRHRWAQDSWEEGGSTAGDGWQRSATKTMGRTNSDPEILEERGLDSPFCRALRSAMENPGSKR